MALSNYERVGNAMEALKVGLAPFVSREFMNRYKGQASQELQRILGTPLDNNKPIHEMDVAALLRVMRDSWREVFFDILGRAELTLVHELQDVRNRWAHQSTFSGDDTYRALDSTHRLLTSVSSPQANDIDKLKMELLRTRFDEQTRTEKRKTTGSLIDSQGTGNLKPDDYILAIVEFLDDNAHNVHYVHEPFRREPDFGVTSVNYNMSELLDRAEAPS